MRLTKWSKDRADCNVGYCSEDCSCCERFKEIREKLIHYEDLEEAGRMMILPETYDKERFMDENCPTVLDLKDTCDVEDCNICWEIALKGETSEWINTNGTKKSAEKSISST